MANLKPHEQYKQMMGLMLSKENATAIDSIIREVALAYKISFVADLEKLNFVYGVTYKIVMMVAKLAKGQGMTNFWLGK
jgi:hypothetical protein